MNDLDDIKEMAVELCDMFSEMKEMAFKLSDMGFLNAAIAGYVRKALELYPNNVMRGLDYAFDEMTAEEAERFYQTGATE